MPRTNVFISYTHDSPEHKGQVLALSDRLRQDGLECLIDWYVSGTPPEGWPRWMLNQIEAADFVLVVCTETYNRRFRGKAEPGEGKGAQWEGGVITQAIYDDAAQNTKFVPVFFDAADVAHIPIMLRGTTYYDHSNEAGYEALYRSLTGQPEVTAPPLGEVRVLPPLEQKAPVSPSPFKPPTTEDAKPKSRDLDREEELDKGTLGIEPEEPEAEPVRLGASAPQAVRPGDEFTARFVAYTPEEEAHVGEMLRKLGPRSATHLGLKTCRWKRGARVTVRLNSRRLEIDAPEQEFVWEGEYVLLDFGVFVPDEAPSRRTTLTFKVFIDGLVVARFGLDLEITTEETTTDRAMTTAEPARSAFASYASEDALRVVDMVSALSSKAGIDIFWDRFSLKPGDRWKDELLKEIKERDLFYLFWSRDAKESEWVEWEWRTALKEKGLDAIEPQPLVPPQEAPPPKELETLHFNDAYMLIRKAIELGSTSG